jgi:hypothetical protein
VRRSRRRRRKTRKEKRTGYATLTNENLSHQITKTDYENTLLLLLLLLLKRYPITGLNRPLGLQEIQAFRILDSKACESVSVVTPTHWQPFTPKRYPGYSFLLEAESTPGP